jgi:hypothetical protein
MIYQERTYRNYVKADNLIKFEVIEKESDLLVLANKNLHNEALALVLKYRAELEKYIQADPKFVKSFTPYFIHYNAPPIAKAMAAAARKAKVGPMAAVAGTIAEFVGKGLLHLTDEIIIENGGDIFFKINQTRKLGIFAGDSPFSEKIALEIEPQEYSFGICCSSGTLGHSFSFGQADAVVVISKSTPLADAAATAIANVVKDAADIDNALKVAKKIRGLDGVLIIKGDQLGALGKIKLVAL